MFSILRSSTRRKKNIQNNSWQFKKKKKPFWQALTNLIAPGRLKWKASIGTKLNKNKNNQHNRIRKKIIDALQELQLFQIHLNIISKTQDSLYLLVAN